MTIPKAKYKLHATRVDRIAIVDNPAVPDAQIIVFKRQKDNEEPTSNSVEFLEKVSTSTGFGRGFILRGTQGAVDALQDEVWGAIYADTKKDSRKLIGAAFEDFRSVINEVVVKLVTIDKASSEDTEGAKFTKKDIVGYFERGLNISAMSAGFSYFRGNLAYTILGYESLKEGQATINSIIDVFKTFVMDISTELVVNKNQVVFEKAGRIISAARLKKLKEAQKVINAIIEETEVRYSKKNNKEADDMELKEVLEKIEEISATVEELKTTQDSLNKVLYEKGILLTDEEVKEAEKAKVEAEKKAVEDKVEAEKKAKEDADAIEKAGKEKVDAEKAELEKAELRIKSIEDKAEASGKLLDAIAKRFGVDKTSLDTDVDIDKSEGDPFRDALRGK